MATTVNQKVAKRLAPFLSIIVKQKDFTIVFLIITILAIIIVPLPSIVLDFFLTISISIAVLIILIALYIPNPTDLTTFPTLILLITLYRLSLNVATTRMILSEGHNGPQAVSDISVIWRVCCRWKLCDWCGCICNFGFD